MTFHHAIPLALLVFLNGCPRTADDSELPSNGDSMGAPLASDSDSRATDDHPGSDVNNSDDARDTLLVGATDTPPGDGVDCAIDSEKYLTVAQVRGLLDSGCAGLLLLNVADVEFYNLGHIAGSLAIPWDALPDRISEVDAQQYIIIYCRRGVRSESAYSTLQAAGHARIWIMDGGIEAWRAAQYPVVEQHE